MAEYEYLLHITVLGSENVGKKTLAKSSLINSFSDLDYMFTIGFEFSSKTVEIEDRIVKLLFRIFSDKQYRWDKTHKLNLGILVRHSLGAIIFYDITNSSSLERIPQWIQIVKDNAGDVPILLVGNKLDLELQREVSKEQIEIIKKKHNITSSMEISIKTGENVEKMFSDLTYLILNHFKIVVEKYKDIPEDQRRVLKEKERQLKTAISGISPTYRNNDILLVFVYMIREYYRERADSTEKKQFQEEIDRLYRMIYEELRKPNPLISSSDRKLKKKVERSDKRRIIDNMVKILGLENIFRDFYKHYRKVDMIYPNTFRQEIIGCIFTVIFCIIVLILAFNGYLRPPFT